VAESGAEEELEEGPSDTRECPYCRETVKQGALKCKHCGSFLPEEQPGHGGECPWCKEPVHPEAIRCKHCRSDLRAPKKTGCGCRGGVPSVMRAPIYEPGTGSGLRRHDCLREYVQCRQELTQLGVPAEDSISWCAFKYWQCTIWPWESFGEAILT
jgi:hypothetical protein